MALPEPGHPAASPQGYLLPSRVCRRLLNLFLSEFQPLLNPLSPPPRLGFGTSRSQLIRRLGETIPLRTGGGEVPAQRGGALLSHGPSGAGGRARLAASAGSPQEAAGGRGRRRQHRLGAGPDGRARPSPLPRPPLRCRPGGRARLQLTGLESRLEAPRPPPPALLPARSRRRPAPRPRHGRRRQRAQQGAQPAAALPLRLLGVSGALEGEGAGQRVTRRRGPGAGPEPGAALGGEGWPRPRSRAGGEVAAALGLRCSPPGSGGAGGRTAWASLGLSWAGPAATSSAGLSRGGCRGRTPRSGPSAPRGSGEGGASRSGVGAAGPPAVPRAGGRLRAGSPPCGGSARRENGAFVTLWGGWVGGGGGRAG